MCAFGVQRAAAQPAAAPQTTSPPTPPTPPTPSTSGGDEGSKLPVSLDRIREGIQREPRLKLDFLDPSIPLFRISVEEKPLKLEDYWKVMPDTAVSRDVRPSFASTWHHEFQSMTTPKQHIAASPFGIFGNPVHPVGPPVLEITKGIKQALSNAQRGRIRRQIQEELKQIEANQAAQQQQEKQRQQTPVPNDPR